MPEIKNQFTGGKMNKDLDERLIPKGEYRDAMNIQVSTSEGSSVGAVQNILGNTLGCTNYASDPSSNPIPSGAFAVGSVSDEKDDSLYWLISGDGYSVDNIVDSNSGFWSGSETVTMKDLIIKKGADKCETVFVDQFAFSQPYGGSQVNSDTLSGIDLSIINQIQPGWTVTGVTADGGTSNTSTIVSLGAIQNNFIPVGWAYETIETAININSYVGYSAHAVASGVLIPFFPTSIEGATSATYAQQLSNFVYVTGFNGDINGLVNDTIEILQDHPSPQTFTIINAESFDITYDGGAPVITVVKLTLDSNLTTFTGPPLDQPSGVGETSSPPYSGSINGNVVDAIITSQDTYNLNIATGELIVDINYLDVNTVSVTDVVYYNNIAYSVQSTNIANNSIYLEDSSGTLLEGWQVGGSIYDVLQPTGGAIMLQSQIQIQLDTNLDLTSQTYTSLLYRGPRTLNFNHNDYITGINIVDDMLFWTDGKTEPKKINIPRSIQGSNIPGTIPGFAHTRLINEYQNIDQWNDVLVREEHITVIKKAPLSAPSIKFGTDARDGVVSGNNTTFELTVSSSAVGQVTIMVPGNDSYGFKKGDVIRLAQEIEGLPGYYDIRVEVIEVDNAQSEYLIRILSLSTGADVTNTSWFGELESIGSFLFERKLPRFAYRYRYLDNEYSSFSPFTNVAFFPGEFKYQPIQAYNIGMQNTIRTLSITDFITSEMPKDVKSIDLLYKNETSPIIYLLETISNNDELIAGENSWNSIGTHDILNSRSGSHEVKTESVSQALPSNQSLRSWDNVPKTAVAQEISGNRIIYGNYTQGYDIKNNYGQTISPNISTVVVSNVVDTGANKASKSIKSLRNYEVGVVWGDKYGRETPVATSKSGSVLVPKSKSKSINHLNVSLESSPSWADYYRFYVKETSNEYYNLAVDRIYDADDGNIWVSFPSVDRNKVDEETYLILKKGADSEELVEQEGRYKVVAIKNEAPDYIKTSYDLIVRTNQDESRPKHSCNLWGGLNNDNTGCTIHPQLGNLNPPMVGRKSFSISYGFWTDDYSTTNRRMGLPDLITQFKEVTSNAETVNNEMYVSFTKEVDNSMGTEVTAGDKYRVIDIKPNVDETEPMGSATNDRYVIYLEKPIGLKDDFVVQGTLATTSGTELLNDNIHVLFWQKSVTNKPEFDGRFFVKILNDSTAQANLSRASTALNAWIVVASPNIYKIDDPALNNTNDLTYNFSPTSIIETTTTAFDDNNSNFGLLNEIAEWSNALRFDGSTPRSRWFIDNAPFAGLYNIDSDTYTTSFTDSSGNPHDSCNMNGNWTINGFDLVSGTTQVTNTFGTGGSYGRVGMKGIHTTGGHNYIDLSFSQLTPDTAPDATGTWDIGNPSTNTSMDEHKAVVDRLVINSRFKLTGGQGIFKIKAITKRRLFNYMGAPTISINAPALYNAAVAELIQDGPTALLQFEQISHPLNKRFSYRIKYELDENASPLIINDPGFSLADEANYDASGVVIDYKVSNITNTIPGGLQFLTEYNEDEENKISYNPAIFETEPKEDVGLDLYYEASSSLPVFPLTNRNKYLFIPLGTTVVSPHGASFPEGVFITQWNNLTPASERIVSLSSPISPTEYSALFGDNGFVQFLRDDGAYVTATLTRDPSTVLATQYELAITPKHEFGLNWHNCWSFNNGVESNRIGDTFNKPYLSNGVTVSTTVKDSPGKESRNYGLIYSGIYNSSSGVNSLNQFIAAEKITKDINPTYGSIQKLYAGWGQGGDLVVLCEDRALKILANKDALYNADGNSNVTSTNNVLGQTIPYSGEYGISKNPESFASEAYRAYFTDKVRGSVMRLSMDGLTPISDHGMKDWFRDNLKLSNRLVGSYDSRKSEYNLTLKGSSKTVSFKEDVKGWVSFKSFTPENAISCANEYYTFNNGLLWKHHDETEDRNTFYKGHPSSGFTPSSINVILNDQPGTVKTFHTLNYEGSQSKVDSFTNYDTYLPGTTIPNSNVYNNEYYNISSKPGWRVQRIQTDLEEGSVNEFIKKEGKWFNHIKGKAGSVVDPGDPTIISGSITSGFDNADFSFQGIGVVASAPEISNVYGCTANGLDVNATGSVNDYFGDGVAAHNYNPLAMIDDNSCIQTIFGCTASGGGGYNVLANTDDGSCVYYGCDDIYAPNYDPSAGFPVTPPGAYIFTNDGSCEAPIYGCMWSETDIHGNPIMSNYNSLANTPCNSIYVSNGSQPNAIPPFNAPSYTTLGDNGCCVPFIYGCMDPNADNYDETANTQTVSSIDPTNPCNTNVYGCSDATACNYYGSVGANYTLIDDGFNCAFCGDALANNWDGVADDGDPYGCSGNTGCLYCKDIANLQQVLGSGSQDTTIDVSWDETWSGNAQVAYYELRYSGDSGATYNYLTNILPGVNQGTVYQSISGLTANTPYTIEVKAICSTGTSVLNPTHNTESGWGTVITIATAATQVTGCMESLACNYDPLANNGDPSWLCEYVSCAGCTDPIATNTTYFVDGDGNTVIATIDDNSCTYIMGCTDVTAFNYDAGATADDSSCVAVTIGCLDDSLNNSGSTYAATNYAGPNTQGIASYTPPTPVANTVCNDNGMNNDCCQYIMPTFYNADIDTNWGGSGLLNTNGWGSTGLWGTLGVNESRKVFAFWDVSLSPKIMLKPTNNTPTKFAYSNDNGYGPGPKTGDIASFNVPSALKFKVAGNSSLNSINTNSSTFAWSNEDGIDNLELIAFESTIYSGKVFFGETPQNYPPNGGTGAHAQVPRFEFWENHIAAHTPAIKTYNVTLGCNDPGNDPYTGVAWSNYNGEIPFFDNSLCSSVVVGDIWGGYDLSFQHTLTTTITTPFTYYLNYHEVVIGYNTLNPHPYINSSPAAYIVQASVVTGNGIADPLNSAWFNYEGQTNPFAPNQSAVYVDSGGTSQNNFSITASIQAFGSSHPSGQWTYYRVRPIISWNGSDYTNAVYGTDMEFWNQSLTIPSSVGTLSYPNADQSTATL